MRQKKAQLTIFILLGIILLIISGLLYFSEETKSLKHEKAIEEEAYMQLCLSQKADHIFRELTKTGASFRHDILFTAYLNSSSLPGLAEIKAAIRNRTLKAIRQCINSSGYNISYAKPEIKIWLLENSTSIAIKNAFTIKKGRLRKKIKQLEIKKPLRLLEMHRVAREILNSSCISAFNTTIGINVLQRNGYILYVLSDKGYDFIFARKAIDLYS